LGSLRFIGLGLYSEKGISLYGLEKAKAADEVLLESYTNMLPGLNLKGLEGLLGRKVKVVDRKYVEDGKDILALASKKDVAMLVAGDPFVATTHIDLRIRAVKRRIPVEVVNAPSIISVAPGAVGLQNYKFGKSCTITFPQPYSDVPYDTLKLNRAAGLHTLFFLDLRAEEKHFMSVDEGIRLLMVMEHRRGEGVINKDLLFIGLARAGGPEQFMKAGRAQDLLSVDFGDPPHVIIVPSRLHFMEAEALVLFAGADKELVERNL
jgi:diphthine synthase